MDTAKVKIFYNNNDVDENQEFQKIVNDTIWDMEDAVSERFKIDLEDKISKKISNNYYSNILNTSFNIFKKLYPDAKISSRMFNIEVKNKIKILFFNKIQNYMSDDNRFYNEKVLFFSDDSDEIKRKKIEEIFEKKWETIFRNALVFSFESIISLIRQEECED